MEIFTNDDLMFVLRVKTMLQVLVKLEEKCHEIEFKKKIGRCKINFKQIKAFINLT